jgi:hypothetical protein
MVLYNSNLAVIKSVLSQADKAQFIFHAREIKSILLDFDLTEKNANERYKFLNLYVWCRTVYKKKYIYTQI